jgi:hypothetical protein
MVPLIDIPLFVLQNFEEVIAVRLPYLFDKRSPDLTELVHKPICAESAEIGGWCVLDLRRTQ